jgi:hypothetical protein
MFETDHALSATPIKRLIWLYWWLLLLEGALRKWILPQWSDPIFLIRDPLVVIIYVLAWRARLFPQTLSLVLLYAVAVGSLALSLAGDAPYLVILFGFRTNYLHVPLIFLMARVMDRDDVVRMGRWWLVTSLPILGLMILQFNSPPDAGVNVGVGGRVAGQIYGAIGHIRPPGPFSFISDVVCYFAFAAAFVLYGWLRRGTYRSWLQLAATLAVVAAFPYSISRSVLFVLLVEVAFLGVLLIRDLRRIPTVIAPVAGIGLILAFTINSAVFQPMTERWDLAETAGGGDFYTNVVGRIVGEYMLPFNLATKAPLAGYGIGLGTVAGARLTTGEFTFLLAESELGRIVMEIGPILGFAFILWRAWLAMALLTKSWRSYVVAGNELPWLLAGAAFFPILNGQWGPATQLGFAVFGAGMTLAALNEPAETKSELELETVATDPTVDSP